MITRDDWITAYHTVRAARDRLRALLVRVNLLSLDECSRDGDALQAEITAALAATKGPA